jgi:hypothetical protein
MNYRPYIWMGEDHDAHVADWRELERGQELIERAKTVSALYNAGNHSAVRMFELQNLSNATATGLIVTQQDAERHRLASMLHGSLGQLPRLW